MQIHEAYIANMYNDIFLLYLQGTTVIMHAYTKYSPPSSPPISPLPMGLQPNSPSANVRQRNQERHTATAKRYKYLRRILKFRQMDFEYAFWQMLYLFVAPQKVYRNFAYRKRKYILPDIT